MRPLKDDEVEERTTMVAEYIRLSEQAMDALRDSPMRGRPNWHLFFQANEELTKVVNRIEYLTTGA